MRFPLHSLLLFFAFAIAVSSAAPPQCRGVNCCFLEPGAPKDMDHRRFDSAVGLGNDALTTKIACPIYANSFDKCRSTGDNQFLIPDYVSAVPVLETQLTMSAEYFKSFQDAADAWSVGASIGGGFTYEEFGASGSFSFKSQVTKKHMHDQQSSLLRTSLHYHGYDVLIDTTSPFHESFERRLDDIAEAVSKNLTYRAAYLAELLIRDYGTQVITSASMSAVIEKDVFITSDTIGDNESAAIEAKAAASASFVNIFSASASINGGYSEDMASKIAKGTTHTELRTVGGPDVKQLTATNFSNPYLVNNLRPIPTGGLPIGDIITQMPNRTFKDVARVRKTIHRATRRYYAENRIPGCTVPGPGYNYMANKADEDACISADPNATHFGGTYADYRTENQGSTIITDDGFIDAVAPLNFKTGGRSCPSGYDGPAQAFSTVLLHEGDAMYWSSPSLCEKNCLFVDDDILKYCDYFNHKHSIIISAYWCRPKSSGVDPDSGLFFGGLIIGEQGPNHFNGGFGCPPTFTAATPILKSPPFTKASLANEEYAESTIVSYVGNRLVATAPYQDVWDHMNRVEGNLLDAEQNITAQQALEMVHPFFSQHKKQYFDCLESDNKTAMCLKAAPEWLNPVNCFA